MDAGESHAPWCGAEDPTPRNLPAVSATRPGPTSFDPRGAGVAGESGPDVEIKVCAPNKGGAGNTEEGIESVP